jgi:hypothetical protein
MKKTNDDQEHRPDEAHSRRDAALRLLGLLGASAVACASPGGGGAQPPLDVVTAALSGAMFVWVDTIGTLPSPLALRSTVGTAGQIAVATRRRRRSDLSRTERRSGA